ncbi:hypothetical protein [Microbispora sp. H10885]|uniref:hypothetical protein n=1 Tax=Microbispora sp. H10885 TaxID=2729110 RepID=UPI0015FEF5C8|nr:hypothetical protein [Microbispora sp. H10885]
MVSLLTASEEEPGATIPLAFPTALWRAIRAVFLVALLVLFPVVRRTVPRALAGTMQAVIRMLLVLVAAVHRRGWR